MGDQAQMLRARMNQMSNRLTPPCHTARVIAVASGKGGVGKSNFCVNFALSLMSSGLRPIVIDTDVGFANVEVLLGVTPTYTILDLLNGKDIWEVIETSPAGLPFLSAGNGLLNLYSLTDADVEKMVHELGQLHEKYDVILLDSGAGMGTQIGRLVSSADELIVVTTPEPTSITDAYALVKMLAIRGELPIARLVVNRVARISDGKSAAEKLQMVVERFLKVKIGVLGYIFEDEAVVRSVMAQEPLYLSFPNSRAANCYEQLVKNYAVQRADVPRTGLSGFIERLFKRSSHSGGGVDFIHPA